ncbi:SCO3242 family prenyltransferase [Streptomyces sp. NPDC017979]|uniref:SCO3242 family prenyltransferase n=1 Tax=Streptomyces sp. NPDC017979 TaxID=3365024 RepID=UPI0037A048EB
MLGRATAPRPGSGSSARPRTRPWDRLRSRASRAHDPGRAAGGDVPGARSARPRDAGTPLRARARAWAELLRVSALFTVPGDALAGASAAGLRPNRGTALAVGASLCLYQAGMALNDWADRAEDAADRPERPIPSGRIAPGAALTAATVLTTAGLTLAARAGRPTLTVATALAATVWSYDLRLKHTKAAPATMAAARTLDLLMGATATATHPARRTGRAPRPGVSPARVTAAPAAASAVAQPSGARTTPTPSAAARTPGIVAGRPAVPLPPTATTPERLARALPAALLLGAHTYAVTAVSQHEVHGGSTLAPLGALGATLAIGAATARDGRPVATALGVGYVRAAAVPYAHAALNPSPPLTRRAVGGGIRAMIPLQAALAARARGSGNVVGPALLALVPIARKLARKVSPT